MSAHPHDQRTPARRVPIAVSMPARNAAPWIAQAIESVLDQESADVHLVVVDDASSDGTADIAAGYAADGVTLLRNSVRRGIGVCHNRALAETTATLVAHVDADDVVLPGALAKLARAVFSAPNVAQAYCDFFPIDVEGRTDPVQRALWSDVFRSRRRPPVDYARELVEHGMVVSALRTYRRGALADIGPFDESLPWAVDFEMALRIAERYTFAHVPEMLYGRRLHAGGASQGRAALPLRQWAMRWRLVRRQLHAQGGTLFGLGRAQTHARLLRGLLPALRASLGSERGP